MLSAEQFDAVTIQRIMFLTRIITNYPLIDFVMAVYDKFMDNYMGYLWELYVFL